MWRQLKEVNSHVGVHLLLTVDVQLLIRVDRHQESPNVSLQRERDKERKPWSATLAHLMMEEIVFLQDDMTL